MTNRIRTTLALAAIAAACTPVYAALPFSQNAGWFQGPPTKVEPRPGNIAAGGVDFFGPLPAFPTAPASTFSTIGWGCLTNDNFLNCAVPGGSPWPVDPATAALGTTGIDPFGQDGRSALRVTGNAGNLDFAPIWTDVTSIDHFNHPVFGNVLNTAQVQSFLRLNGTIVDTGGGPSLTTVNFFETFNDNCNQQAAPGAPINPIGTTCDDFAFVSGLDLSPIQLTPTLGVKFRLDAPPFVPGVSGALVCPGAGAPGGQPAACGSYDGAEGILIYTAEGAINHFSIQAQLFEGKIPLFVIGDCEYLQAPPGQAKKNPIPATENNLREVNDVVNFWGSQWWKNNCMSLFVDNGYPAFKGFATNVDLNTHTAAAPCGLWQARPGNSGHPPDKSVIGNPIAIIVTDNVIKDGPNIGGNIKQIVLVDRAQPPGLDNYDGNPGHQGWGKIIQITCGQDPGQVP